VTTLELCLSVGGFLFDPSRCSCPLLWRWRTIRLHSHHPFSTNTQMHTSNTECIKVVSEQLSLVKTADSMIRCHVRSNRGAYRGAGRFREPPTAGHLAICTSVRRAEYVLLQPTFMPKFQIIPRSMLLQTFERQVCFRRSSRCEAHGFM
jgi:hypothetical protein